MFRSSIVLLRGRVIDYLCGASNVTIEWVIEEAKKSIALKQLTEDEVFETIDKIEEDNLCLPYLPREEKIRKIRLLKKHL